MIDFTNCKIFNKVGIKAKLWKEMFWSQSFCLLTVNGVTVTMDIIKQYIKSQGRKNDK